MRPSAIAGGTYASKQIFSRSRLVAWSHGRRFAVAAELATADAGRCLLDYGCGDGTFVAMVHDRFETAIGTDVDARQLADCAARFRDLPKLAFVPQQLVDGDPRHAAAYDVVTCMEVLEHCVDERRAHVIAQLRRLVKPAGRVIVSVPIETGLSLPAKQMARRIAGWRGIGDYRHTERYSWPELLRMTCARAGTRVERPIYQSAASTVPGVFQFHGHKGFNWRVVASELSSVFEVFDCRYSPLSVFGPVLNSQVWLVCRPL